MADDLDFRHNVSEIPAGEQLPKTERTVGVERSSVPDIQSAVSNYAADTNWLSGIGSSVAASASNAIAQRIGGELGKNPQGDIGVPITDFDKTMQESYSAQAEATLGIQAQTLITKSNIALASMDRLDPGTIAKNQAKVQEGLQQIYEMAPSSIRPQFEHQYDSVMLQQSEHLADKMISQQKDDRRNRTDLATSLNTQNAYSLSLNGTSLNKDGESTAGLAAVEAVKKQAAAAVAVGDKTPLEAKVMVDAARQSYLSGKVTRQALQADKNGKLPEFLKSLADNPPKDIKPEDHDVVYNNVLSYMNKQAQLKSQDQQLTMESYKVQLLSDPMGAATTLPSLQSQLSPLQFQQMKVATLQAQAKMQETEGNINELLANWGDSTVQARAKPDAQNKAFDMRVQQVVAHGSQNNNPISQDMAEVQVAASAGAPIPIFVKSLNDKATSGNPVSIASAADQIQLLRTMGDGHALIGLSKQAEAIATQFSTQRGSMPDADLARKITDNIQNIDSAKLATINNGWNLKVSALGASGMGKSQSLSDMALQQVDLGNKNLGGGFFKVLYGNDIYQQLYSNYIASGGDYDSALKMTKDYVNQHYSETRINGDTRYTDNGIEKALGYKDPKVVPYIQEDMVNQLSKSFEDNKNPNDYWTAEPVKPISPLVHMFPTYPAVQVIRHVKTDSGEKKYMYPVNLVGRPGNQWDVVLQTPSGYRNFFLVAPHLGITTYKPNAEAIKKRYESEVPKGWF
jgi:hypothetical protein